MTIDAHEFETFLSRFVTHVTSIKNPGDVDIRLVFPNDWLFEETPLLYAVGIPIPREAMRGLIPVRETDTWTYYMITSPRDYWPFFWEVGPYYGIPYPPIIYFNRGGKMNPDTDIYIAPTWYGQPFNWGRIEGGAADKITYPREVNLSYFTLHKVVRQPYMIPPQATHGVYQEWRSKPATGNTGNLAAIVRQMWDANPYLDKSDSERLKTPTIPQLVAQMPVEVTRVSDDVAMYLDLIKNLETKYFRPNFSTYDRQNEVADYKNSMENIKAQLAQINDYLEIIRKWDFSNLEKYRSQKASLAPLSSRIQ